MQAAASWDTLIEALAAFPADEVAPPTGGRIGGVLILLRELEDGDLEIVYTRRRDDMRSHPGQVSFPGGRLDPGESIEQCAVREAHEEVGLDPASVTVLGRLPSFYIPPSRFWLQAVLARWDAPHPLVAAEAEVAEVLHVRLSHLLDRESWRGVQMSTAGWSWAWDLGGGHLLWGATAILTALLLDLLVGDWTGGLTPADLPPDRHVQPWRAAGRQVPLPGPARLRDIPEYHRDQLPAPNGVARPDADGARRAGAAIAEAVRRLGPAPGRVAVLVGSGWTGAAGLMAAADLTASGVAVSVIPGGNRLPPLADEVGLPLQDDLPSADVVVDALVGRGLTGALRARPLALAHRLRSQLPTVVAVDLPSGLHPVTGMVGELLPADVTVALGVPAPGLYRPGMGPFVGDLYVALLAAAPLVRLVPGPDGVRWRE
jgi:NAD(P)H-hydrate repair Nnr-like enzyme with NAD(P)H-hydrate epimerase domain/8-oxo-dGTP pyrophosphatase MutT (NUDIX family)